MDSPKEHLQTLSRSVLKGLAGLIVGTLHALRAMPGQVKEGFHEAKVGLKSLDQPTRRMSVVFYLSLAGVAFTAYQFGTYAVERRARQRELRRIEEIKLEDERLRAEELRRLREPPPYQSLGTFTLEIREQEGVARSNGMNAAEMEIVVSCSEEETCNWLKDHIDLSRGELGSLFTPTDREKILSNNGKKAFREEIRDSLNKLLEERKVKGTILEVLFPRFIVS